MTTGQAPVPDEGRASVERLVGLMVGAHVSIMILVGLRLGLYRALKDTGPATSDELASHTGLHERWLREWLQGQAAAGVIYYRNNGRFELSPAAASFDLITTFDCLHDLTRPAEAAAAIRAAVGPDGTWFIIDFNTAPTFEENLKNPLAPMLYALSVLWCMNSGLSEPGGAGLGTLGLPEPAMRELVSAAGFTRFRRLDLSHPVNAFYEARP